MIGCQTGKQSVVSDYHLQTGKFESIIQTGNWLKFFSNLRADPYTGTLNPGKMISEGREYYILKYENRDQDLSISLEDGDTLTLILEGRSLNLTSYNTNGQQNKLSAYYEINKWDLIDIGNTSDVIIIIKTGEGDLKATFSRNNIYNYKYFSAKYILGVDEMPPASQSTYKQPLAFLSGGAGSGTEFWFGYYTNLISFIPGLGDYLAAGMGIEKFEYSRYNYFSLKGYLWDGNSSLNSYYINAMYGLTYPSPYGNWSFELGLTYQYYFYDENWNSKNTGTNHFPTIYRLKDGNPYEGSVIGVFLQAGGLWVQFNRRKNWAVGIAIPIPWW
jgi:hypothetical protein